MILSTVPDACALETEGAGAFIKEIRVRLEEGTSRATFLQGKTKTSTLSYRFSFKHDRYTFQISLNHD